MNSLFIAALAFGCQEKIKQTIEGRAQGTTYQITFVARDGVVVKREIDSVLRGLDASLSTYDSQSIISRVNRNDTSVVLDQYFLDVFEKSVEVSELTGGLFDIAVAPLVNAYGFGPAKRSRIDSPAIDSLRKFVGYRNVTLNERSRIVKTRPEITLDFNAIAQGYSVDVIASYLEKKGVNDFLVELGGEVTAKGKKAPDSIWTVGIDKPEEDPMFERGLQAALPLNDMSMATSGNYRKFYEENGKRYAHIINPLTGYTQRHDLLSATVFAKDCMTADAYATAFMVMGREQTIDFLSKNQQLGLAVYLIYDNGNTWSSYVSPTLKNLVSE
jgi:FAD:protein FMN transferase